MALTLRNEGNSSPQTLRIGSPLVSMKTKIIRTKCSIDAATTVISVPLLVFIVRPFLPGAAIAPRKIPWVSVLSLDFNEIDQVGIVDRFTIFRIPGPDVAIDDSYTYYLTLLGLFPRWQHSPPESRLLPLTLRRKGTLDMTSSLIIPFPLIGARLSIAPPIIRSLP